MGSTHITSHGHPGPAQPLEVFGRAFPIDDALLAMRWADLVRSKGYRLTFSHRFANADEVIVVHLPPIETAIARVYRGTRRVWLADCVGLTRPYEDLALALLSVVPLSRRDTSVLLTPHMPPWLWSPRSTAVPGSGLVRRFVTVLAGWLASAFRR